MAAKMTKQVRNLRSGDVAMGKTVDYVRNYEGWSDAVGTVDKTMIFFVDGTSIEGLGAKSRLPRDAQD